MTRAAGGPATTTIERMIDAITPASESPVALVRSRDVAHPERAVARAELIPIRRGVYAPAAQWHELAPWERYAARVHAFALTSPTAVFSHESAAVLLGLPIFGDPVTVHILASPDGSAGLLGGVRVHTASQPRQVSTVGGLLTTSPLETAIDLARLRHEVVGLAVADAVLRSAPDVSVESLVAHNESRSSSRGRRLARWSLHRADAASESTLESVSRAAIEWLGYPAPELQRWFRSRDGVEDRSDFVWPGYGVVGEADGDSKYDGRFGHAPALLRRRRERDARLRESVRVVAHWGWSDVVAYRSLASMLDSAGLRAEAAPDIARLQGMQQALAPRPGDGAPRRLSPRPPARPDAAAETTG